jgi:hypothetical protein
MSFLDSLFNRQQAAQPQPAPQPQGNVGAAPSQVQQPIQQPQPQEMFADLWKAPETPPNATTQPVDPFNYQTFHDTASKVSLLNSIPQDLKSQIESGGPEAMQALQKVMEVMGQNVFAQSAFTSTKIAQNLVDQAKQAFLSELPNILKTHTAKETLFTKNPALNNPALKPLFEAVQQQFATKHRDASPTELNKMVEEYFTQVVIPATMPATQQQQAPKQSQEVDWNKFLQE